MKRLHEPEAPSRHLAEKFISFGETLNEVLILPLEYPLVIPAASTVGAGQILFPMLSRLLVLVAGQRNGPAVFSCAT